MKIQSSVARLVRPAILGTLLTALAAPVDVSAEDATQAYELEDIVVVGSRRPIRSVTDALAPVDLIGAEDFTDQGTTNLPDLMRALVPSYNH